MRPRRAVLLVALLAASCAQEPPPVPQNFAPLDFSYLLPLRLNVADVQITQHYLPSGQPPDVSALDPAQPVAALRLMGEQRLKAEGTSGHADFVINDASLIQQGDLVTGTFSVELDIIGESGAREGFAQATVVRQLAGVTQAALPAALYGLTKTMMAQMNVEFEYQVRHSLSTFLLPEGATQAPVQASPLPGPDQQPGPPSPIVPTQVAPPENLVPPIGPQAPPLPPTPLVPPGFSSPPPRS